MKTLKDQLEIIQAALDGKDIEVRDDTVKWTQKLGSQFNFIDYDYRIKPEPMEFWANVSLDGSVIGAIRHTKAETLDKWKEANIAFKTIKVREVIE